MPGGAIAAGGTVRPRQSKPNAVGNKVKSLCKSCEYLRRRGGAQDERVRAREGDGAGGATEKIGSRACLRRRSA